MKTKVISLLAAGLFFCIPLIHAQTDGGFILGISTSSVKMSDMNRSTATTADGTNILGFEGGLFARFHFGPFYIKPMALLSYQSGQLNFYNSDGSTQQANFNVGKFEVPVLFGVHFLRILNIEAGPVCNWLFQSNTDANNTLKIQPVGYGYRVGANVELGRFLIGLDYQGLVNPSSSSSNITYNVPNELILELGFNIGKK